MATFTQRGSGQYVAGEAHYLHLPKQGFSTRKACIVHGGGGQRNTETAPPNNGVQSALADRGIASIGADFADGYTFGSDTGVTRVGQLATYVSGIGAPSDKYLLYGASMGFCTLANWAWRNQSKVAAFAGVIPLCDLADVHDNNRDGFAAQIETAYGGLAAYQAAIGTHNPLTWASDLKFPIKIWYSTDDPRTIPSATLAFAAASGAQLVSMGAIGHTAVDRTGEVVDFLDRYA
jgi:predicted alpha/beta hydrolase family esterase